MKTSFKEFLEEGKSIKMKKIPKTVKATSDTTLGELANKSVSVTAGGDKNFFLVFKKRKVMSSHYVDVYLVSKFGEGTAISRTNGLEDTFSKTMDRLSTTYKQQGIKVN